MSSLSKDRRCITWIPRGIITDASLFVYSDGGILNIAKNKIQNDNPENNREHKLEHLETVFHGSSPITAIDCSQDGLIAYSMDKRLLIRKFTEKGTEQISYKSFDTRIHSLKWIARKILTIASQQTISIWDQDKQSIIHTYELNCYTSKIVWMGPGSFAAIVHDAVKFYEIVRDVDVNNIDGDVKKIKLESKTGQYEELETYDFTETKIQVREDGIEHENVHSVARWDDWLITASEECVKIWKLTNGQWVLFQTLPYSNQDSSYDAKITAICWLSNATLVVGQFGGDFKLWAQNPDDDQFGIISEENHGHGLCSMAALGKEIAINSNTRIVVTEGFSKKTRLEKIILCGLAAPNTTWGQFLIKGLYDPRLFLWVYHYGNGFTDDYSAQEQRRKQKESELLENPPTPKRIIGTILIIEITSEDGYRSRERTLVEPVFEDEPHPEKFLRDNGQNYERFEQTAREINDIVNDEEFKIRERQLLDEYDALIRNQIEEKIPGPPRKIIGARIREIELKERNRKLLELTPVYEGENFDSSNLFLYRDKYEYKTLKETIDEINKVEAVEDFEQEKEELLTTYYDAIQEQLAR